MTEAIFGFAGVLVGAFSQGAWAWTMERRREEWAARKAGRLLARSLTRARWALRLPQEAGIGSWSVVVMEVDAALGRWPEHGDVLAGTLPSTEDWHTIVSAIEALDRIHTRAKYASNDTIEQADAEHLAYIAEMTWDAAFT